MMLNGNSARRAPSSVTGPVMALQRGRQMGNASDNLGAVSAALWLWPQLAVRGSEPCPMCAMPRSDAVPGWA